MSDSSTNPVQNQIVKAYVDQYKGTVTSITLTQGTGITISNSGTAITTSGSRTISLASITKSDTTSTASPSHGGTFTAIDSITYDTYGRVTGVNTKTITLPADSNTDTKVTQAYSTANNSYPVLFSATAGVSSTSSRGATTAILNNAIYANPSTGDLQVTKLNGVTVGASPKFTDTTYTNISEFTNDAGYITSADVPEGASAYTGAISAVGTTASNGTNNGFARGDHVHNITSSTITSALGYTPYNGATNPNGYISSYTDEQLKWTASTTSNTYYPLQSTSTATTSTANTLNGISFYQYYNTAGGYRRLDLGNSTAYKSTGGAYGTIRLYGAAATYYGDLVPGVLGTTTGDGHISANRTWTLPDKTGTIALTSDIPDVSSFITDAGVTKITTTAGTHSAITNATGAVSFNVPTTAAHVGAATSDHTHGNITNAGDITATAPTIASGDQIIINDNSASKITNGPTFDGSTTTTALTPKGTWETFSKFSGSYNDLSNKPTIPTEPTSYLLGLYPTSGSSNNNQWAQNFDTRLWFKAGTNMGIALDGSTMTFNATVPTKTSDLTNDSGFITTDSDEKVKTVALTSGTTYYPVLATGANDAANRQVDSTLAGFKYASTAGTTSTVGTARLTLGNTTASGTTNNERGVIRLYGTTSYYTDITAETGLPAANRTIYVPSYAGTMFLTCTNTTDAVGGATTAPVYVDNTGCIKAVTSIPYSLLSGTPTIPTNTNTTYTLTNALASHKFTWTFTAGGSGSGSTTTTAELVAGTGITLTDDTTNKKITIACSVTNTDEKVTQTTDSGSNWRKILASYNSVSTASASITSGTTNTNYYNNNVSMQPSTGSIYVGGSYYMYLNENTSDALYSAISDLGWTTDVIE